MVCESRLQSDPSQSADTNSLVGVTARKHSQPWSRLATGRLVGKPYLTGLGKGNPLFGCNHLRLTDLDSPKTQSC